MEALSLSCCWCDFFALHFSYYFTAELARQSSRRSISAPKSIFIFLLQKGINNTSYCNHFRNDNSRIVWQTTNQAYFMVSYQRSTCGTRRTINMLRRRTALWIFAEEKWIVVRRKGKTSTNLSILHGDCTEHMVAVPRLLARNTLLYLKIQRKWNGIHIALEKYNTFIMLLESIEMYTRRSNGCGKTAGARVRVSVWARASNSMHIECVSFL